MDCSIVTPIPYRPEFRLAAACAMWPPSDYRTEAIRSAVGGPLDWPSFLRVANRHQLVGLIHDGLTRAQTDVPPEITREIGAQATKQVRENLAMAREALRLQRLFDDADLPVLFIKGSALAVLAFGNLGLRTGQDIDLLIAPENLAAAAALIMRAGYRRFDPPPNTSDAQLQLVIPHRKDFGFVHNTTGIKIELHWRLFLNPHAMIAPSIKDSRVVLATRAGGLRTLGEDDLIAYLCMHGALHWWNRLKWLADVNALLSSKLNGGIERLIRATESRGAGRAGLQALLLCQRLLGLSLPDRLIATRINSASMRWLESTALKAMTIGDGEQNPHERRFGTTRGSLSTFLLNQGWRYWLAELKVHLNSHTDILMVPLPGRLRFLYPLLRLPLWVWRHTFRISEK